MSLFIRIPRRSTDAPEGVHRAVCVDIIDLGMVPNTYGKGKDKVHKIEICWYLAAKNPATNKPFFAAKQYTFSLSPRANLRKDLESWLGRGLEPGGNLDLESFVGLNCRLTVTCKASDWNDTVFSNITAIEPINDQEGFLPVPVSDYVRQQPEPPEKEEEPSREIVVTDEDIPF